MSLNSTVIRANIVDEGVAIYIKSPEIADILESGIFLEYYWLNKEDINSKYSMHISLGNIAPFLAKSRSKRSKEDYRRFLSNSNVANFFNYAVLKLNKNNEVLERGGAYFNCDDYKIFNINNGSMNLGCLASPNIREGCSFVAPGVFTKKIIERNIIVPLREYIFAFLRVYRKF